MRLRSLFTLGAAIVLFAACGGDDGDEATDDQPEATDAAAVNGTAATEPGEEGELLPLEDFEFEEEFTVSSLDIDSDELRARADELFDGETRGRGSGTLGGRSHIIVMVDPDDVTDAQMLEACESLTDWVDGLPEDQASGPVDILISDDMQVGPDEQYLVVNDGLVAGESRGSCQVQ